MADFSSIPEPKIPDADRPLDKQFLVQGALEDRQLANRFSLERKHTDSLIRWVLKPALFLFVIGLNWWWAKNISKMLWESGREGSRFHLSDKVLIALVTTSVANFLVLIHIVARHLFPDPKHMKSKHE